MREFVRPRSWLFGEHRATPEDEAFLAELLEDAVTGAVERTRAALLEALAPGRAPVPAEAAGIPEAIATAVDRFSAYARGVIEAGAVPEFFRHQLPRLRLDTAAIRDALTRRAPDPEEALFAPLRRSLDALHAAAAARLATAEVDAEMRALLHGERIAAPLTALAAAVAELESAPPA